MKFFLCDASKFTGVSATDDDTNGYFAGFFTGVSLLLSVLLS